MASELFEVPLTSVLAMLIVMFISTLLPMLLFSRLTPQLILDSHSKTSWINGLRGIAAATVALNHAPLAIINLQLIPRAFTFNEKALALFSFCGSIGVQIFFCITGMLFVNKVLFTHTIDWTSFFQKRIRRIVPAYFMVSTLALIIGLLYPSSSPQSLNQIVASIPSIFSFGLMPLPKINDFDFVRLLGINWTLAMEWRFYLILPIVFLLLRDLRTFSFIAITIFAILDLSLTNIGSWVYFISGALCAPLMHKQFNNTIRAAAYISLILIGIFYLINWSAYANYGLVRWIAMSAFFISAVVARPQFLEWRSTIAMGTVSYSFYLLHCLVLFIISSLLHLFFNITTISLPLFTCLASGILAFITILSIFSYLTIERPFMFPTHKHKGVTTNDSMDNINKASQLI